MLISGDHGGRIKYDGEIPQIDEDLTPTLESDIVLDWLDALGGQKFVDHVFRVFSKELETDSLPDLRQTVSENLNNLLAESAQQAELNRARAFSSFWEALGQENHGGP